MNHVQPRCLCGSQEKARRELQGKDGKWRESLRYGAGVPERITCGSCGAQFIRTSATEVKA